MSSEDMKLGGGRVVGPPWRSVTALRVGKIKTHCIHVWSCQRLNERDSKRLHVDFSVNINITYSITIATLCHLQSPRLETRV